MPGWLRRALRATLSERPRPVQDDQRAVIESEQTDSPAAVEPPQADPDSADQPISAPLRPVMREGGLAPSQGAHAPAQSGYVAASLRDTEPFAAPEIEPPRRRLSETRHLTNVLERRMPEGGISWGAAAAPTSIHGALFLSRNALAELKSHVDWGQRTARNVVEQGGLLVGYAYTNADQIWTDVIAALPGDTGEATSGSLHFSPRLMLQLVQDYHARVSEGSVPADSTIVGWYHTHPNRLPVFLSGTDMYTQSNHFGKNWQFALVANPHTGLARCFRGASALECAVYVAPERNVVL